MARACSAGNAVGAEQEFHGRRIGNLTGEPDGGAATGEETPLGFHDPEVGLGHSHPQVATSEHLHAAGHTGPVHGGDDRFVQLHAAEHGPHPVVDPVAVQFLQLATGDVLLQLGDLGDVGLEIGTHAEGVTHAGDDGHPGLVLLTETVPGHPQLGEVVHVETVHGLGSVDGDPHHMVVTGLVVDGHAISSARGEDRESAPRSRCAGPRRSRRPRWPICSTTTDAATSP